MSMLKINLKEI